MPMCASFPQSVNTTPRRRGFVVTFTIDEGSQYRVGTVEVISNVRRDRSGRALRSQLKLSDGSVYNAGPRRKNRRVNDGPGRQARLCLSPTVRPRGDRNFETKTINLAFVVEEGARAYIERINIRGNTRTRDYVIRREFDLRRGRCL